MSYFKSNWPDDKSVSQTLSLCLMKSLIVASCSNNNSFDLNSNRVSWELTFGPIPKGIYVCHKCDNKKCVNPHHLFLGTAKDNSKDMTAKKGGIHSRKTHCKKGHEFSKENTYINPASNGRICKVCRLAYSQSWYRVSKLISR